METFKPGVYQHFRNNRRYLAIAVGRHSETEEELVIYRALYDTDQPYWVRPASMFLEKVEYFDKKVPRFQRVTQEELQDASHEQAQLGILSIAAEVIRWELYLSPERAREIAIHVFESILPLLKEEK